MLFLASRFGALGTRIGPRIPMTVGPLVMAVGVLMLLPLGADVTTVADVLPGLTVFGLGLALMVAPLTSTVLAAAPDEHAGIASGRQQRGGPRRLAAGGRGAAGRGRPHRRVVRRPGGVRRGVPQAMVVCAVLLVLGGVVSWLTIRPTVLEDSAPELPRPASQ